MGLLELEFEGALNNKQGQHCSAEAFPLEGKKKGCLEKPGLGVKIEDHTLHIGERGWFILRRTAEGFLGVWWFRNGIFQFSIPAKTMHHSLLPI